MIITVQFFSYFKELAGCGRHVQTLPEGASLSQLLDSLLLQFPKLQPFHKSTLVAVGVEYQSLDYELHDGDEVSLFPPVQGG